MSLASEASARPTHLTESRKVQRLYVQTERHRCWSDVLSVHDSVVRNLQDIELLIYEDLDLSVHPGLQQPRAIVD